MPDIDIDFLDRDQALKLFDHTPASRLDDGKIVKHNTGVYLHSVPHPVAAVAHNKLFTRGGDDDAVIRKNSIEIKYHSLNVSQD